MQSQQETPAGRCACQGWWGPGRNRPEQHGGAETGDQPRRPTANPALCPSVLDRGLKHIYVMKN